MTVLLPMTRATATRKSMQGRFVSLFVMLAISFGSIVAPATAHAEDIFASHSSEIFAVLEHADDAGHGDSHKQNGDAPCHAISHHHCSVAVAVDDTALSVGGTLREVALLPLIATAMSSLAQAPPTEPPAARS